MDKKILIGSLMGLLVVSSGVWYLYSKNNQTNQQNEETQETDSQNVTNHENSNTPNDSVPLPLEEDIISLFFHLINEHRIPEVIKMMSLSLVPDDNTKQSWGIHFNAIESIHVQQIEPYMENIWTENKHIYQVTLEARVSDEAANAPIPYYGWSGNPEARWITIEKNQGGEWQIAEIATGP